MSKFNDKYRIESNRMPGWDYSGNGYYFITPVIQNMKCILGKIENGEMILSDFGKIANNEWHKSFKMRKELILDEYIMMPNHLHAIVIINKMGDSHDDSHDSHDDSHVQTHGRASLHSPHSPQSPQSPHPNCIRKPKSLSSFMAGYKSAVTTKIDDFIDSHNLPIEKFNRENKFWQSNYNDHVIRDGNEYWRIKNYIKNNPKNWNEDKFR